MKNLKRGFEFALKDATYKITETPETNKNLKEYNFLAIYVGSGLYRDNTTYNGYVKHGDFRTDNSLFSYDTEGEVTKVQSATGIMGLEESKSNYKKAMNINT